MPEEPQQPPIAVRSFGASSEKGKRLRNRVIEGESVECEFHAKPTEGVPPDLCARIYFATGTQSPFVKMGYIGRHLE